MIIKVLVSLLSLSFLSIGFLNAKIIYSGKYNCFQNFKENVSNIAEKIFSNITLKLNDNKTNYSNDLNVEYNLLNVELLNFKVTDNNDKWEVEGIL